MNYKKMMKILGWILIFLLNTVATAGENGSEAVDVELKSESGPLPDRIIERLKTETIGLRSWGTGHVFEIVPFDDLPLGAQKTYKQYLESHELRDSSRLLELFHPDMIEPDGTLGRENLLGRFEEFADAGMFIPLVAISQDGSIYAEGLEYAFDPNNGGMMLNRGSVELEKKLESGKYLIVQC